MKKTLLFASLLAIATFSSCSKNETLNVNKTQNEIGFNAYTNSPTKAEIISSTNFNEFNVYGYRTTDAYNGEGDLIPYFKNLGITREDENRPWTHADKYYWPINDEKLQFFAISPLNELVTNYNISSESYPSFNYTIGTEGDNQKDLIVSNLLNQEKPNEGGEINLNFKHVLSQINFSLKGEVDNFEYKITKIELQYVKNSGKFTFDETSGVWSDQAGTTTYTHNLTDFIIKGTTLTPLNDIDKTFILLPQTTTKNAKIKVTYSVIETATNTEIFNSSKEVNVSSTTWAKNSNIRYNLTLPVGGEEMTFTAEINDWNKETNKELSIFELNKTDLSINIGETEKLTTKLFPANENATYSWDSRNPAIATVTDGVITAISKGTTIISVTTGEQTIICYVTVIPKPISIPDPYFKQALINANFDRNRDNEISITEALNIQTLNLSKKNIKSLKGIENFTELTKLNCNETKISSLDVSKNSKLTSLSCDKTAITSLNVSKNLNLTYLHCNETAISSLDVSKNTKLTSLSCSINKIPVLNVDNNIKLTLLHCSDTKIASLNINNNIDLTDLSCSETDVTSLDVSKNINLKSLYCYSTDIASLDLSKNPVLESISCSSTDITSLDISNNIEINDISCDNTTISTLDLSKITKLQCLICSSTDISSLNLNNNINLSYFSCYNTDITSLDISKNTALTFFNCDYCLLLKEIVVWPSFDIENVPTNFKKPITINYVKK
ncbi:MAG: fimbrillin family protein [Bacteroidetes bacterium]|nr:fimbrillin family protein [Bacteroidota bacterium]